MGELKEGESSAGDPPEILLIEGLEPSIVDLSDSPHVRRSLRKTPFRNHPARVRLSKAKPKSPFFRLAEMKRSGLRGRKPLHPEVRGLGGSDSKRGKLGRGSGLKLLEPIPESDGGVVEQMEGSVVGQGNLGMEEIGLSGDGGSGGMSGSSEVVLADGSLNSCGGGSAGIEAWKKKGGSYKQVLQRERIPPGDLSDFSLDLIVAQPLQETNFVAEQMLPEVHLGDVLDVDALMPESMMAEEELRLDEDFPLFCKERLKMAKDKAKNKGAFAQNEGSHVEQQTSGGIRLIMVNLVRGWRIGTRKVKNLARGLRQKAVSQMVVGIISLLWRMVLDQGLMILFVLSRKRSERLVSLVKARGSLQSTSQGRIPIFWQKSWGMQ